MIVYPTGFGKSPKGCRVIKTRKREKERVYISIYPLCRYSALVIWIGIRRTDSHEGEWSPFWYDNPTPTLSISWLMDVFGDAASTTQSSFSVCFSRTAIISLSTSYGTAMSLYLDSFGDWRRSAQDRLHSNSRAMF